MKHGEKLGQYKLINKAEKRAKRRAESRERARWGKKRRQKRLIEE
jgi:hypothetical protein